jgi:hypothetical protein
MVDAPHNRWYCLTPDRLVIGLLAAEGLLLLAERFRWFPFNEHKGWTVLIAVASVGLVAILMLFWFAASLLFGWRFQYSIRSLLVMVVAVAVPCSWLAVEMKKAREQKKAVEAVRRLGFIDSYDYRIDLGKTPPAPEWLRRLLGDEFFVSVVALYATRPQVTDAAMEHVKRLTRLKRLALNDTQLTDTALEHLKGLDQLESLTLDNTQVTDAGVGHLKGLVQIQLLGLVNTRVTGAGLEHFTRLQSLELNGSSVTDAGLKHLKGLGQLQWLTLERTKVTDAGLEPLEELVQLERLHLDKTQVTDAGLEHLKGLTRLEYLSLAYLRVTDTGLGHLQGLNQLRLLNLDNTEVTDHGVKKLQQTLPNCLIHHWHFQP